MKPRFKTLAAATLLCSTAFVPAALAQSNQQMAQGEQACGELELVVQENQERFQREWLDLANDAVAQANAEECATYVTQAEEAIASLERGEPNTQSAQADIIVTQPEPEVTVDLDAPEVTVDQAQPQVSVQQAQPQIIVRQAQPTVTVQMPQPTITIDQPEPEIIVRMPEPDVSVGVPEPEVSVSQAQPQIQVEQGQPQVRLAEPDVAVRGQSEAEVQVQGGEPVVRLEETEQAELSVEQAQPQVSYESAEPKVEFESAGEPQVQFTESGEPNIRVEGMEQGEQQAAAAQQDGQQDSQEQEFTRLSGEEEQQLSSSTETAADEERPAQGEQTASAENPAGVDAGQTASIDRFAMLRAEPGQQEQMGDPSTVRVSDIMGRNLVNARGEELGTIDNVVTSGDRSYVVLASGGFLGMGEEEVALPLNRISMEQGSNELIMRGMTEAEIEAMPNFDAENAQEITGDQEVEVGSG